MGLSDFPLQSSAVRQDTGSFRKSYLALDANKMQAGFPRCIKIRQGIADKNAAIRVKPVSSKKIAYMNRFSLWANHGFFENNLSFLFVLLYIAARPPGCQK